MAHTVPPRPDFYLWHPEIRADGVESTVEFDVTPAAARYLHSGDAELCAGFLRDLGVTVDEVLEWTVDRFCSPYYSDQPATAEWTERFRIAWHVTVRARGATRSRYAGPGPFRAAGADSSWSPAGTFWLPTTEPCVIIADRVVASQDVGASEHLGAELGRMFAGYDVRQRLLRVAGGAVRQFRIALGPLDVPQDHQQIEDVVAGCEQVGLLTDCRHTIAHVVDLAEHTGTPPTR